MKKAIIITIILSITFALTSFNYHRTTNKSAFEKVAKSQFTGNWSSEGDTKASGILTFEIEQVNAKITGTAEYNLYDDSQNSGLLSVNGYVKKNVAYIRFRGQKGQVIADGTLIKNQTGLTFKQTTKSSWLPKIGYVFRE